jgi:hypothetical protein
MNKDDKSFLFVYTSKNYTAILLSFQRAIVCTSPECRRLGITVAWLAFFSVGQLRHSYGWIDFVKSYTLQLQCLTGVSRFVQNVGSLLLLLSLSWNQITRWASMSYRCASPISHDYVLSAARLCALNWGIFRSVRFFLFVCCVLCTIMFSFWSTAADLYTH